MSKTATKKKPRSARNEADWKGNAPNRGQWKAREVDDEASGTGFVTVSVKMRATERDAFREVCKSRNVTPNKAMRTFARKCSGFLEIGDEALDRLGVITRQISGVSTNINQIAKAANRTHEPDFIAFMEDRQELGLHLASLEDVLREVVNVARLRSDGLRKLDEVLAES